MAQLTSNKMKPKALFTSSLFFHVFCSLGCDFLSTVSFWNRQIAVFLWLIWKSFQNSQKVVYGANTHNKRTFSYVSFDVRSKEQFERCDISTLFKRLNSKVQKGPTYSFTTKNGSSKAILVDSLSPPLNLQGACKTKS